MLPAKEVIDILAASICSHQKSLAQYTFLTDEKHKEIKYAHLKKREIKGKEKFDELQEYLYYEFGNIFDKQMGYLQEIFNPKFRESRFNVRACLKIIVEEETIVTLYRIPESDVCDAFPFFENTAFANILKKKGNYYMCNDIPNAVKEGQYVNNRIDLDKVNRYQDVDTEMSGGSDDKWIDCWKNRESEDLDQKRETCYKSTLVVPMSLTTKGLDIQFKKHLRIPSESERAIFGFLCLDHPSKNFFNLEMDVEIACIFADMLSLYLIHQLTITQYSSISLAFTHQKGYLDSPNEIQIVGAK